MDAMLSFDYSLDITSEIDASLFMGQVAQFRELHKTKLNSSLSKTRIELDQIAFSMLENYVNFL